ncbi:hypothetical protein ASG39_21595 [Rhizobium sp. Leaf371]|uniref:Pycsar system effector family protein n=1 Tax=Rhizobium sp. Leaf371 TaxID=1736355 RepID=UPI0007152AFA|nr:Pycsar system effector family protein [Rhizobium sp. Leaf371]KQS71458.1 hypothetical protein ASG39_21595 [Rhizobium sp. Leaf371]
MYDARTGARTVESALADKEYFDHIKTVNEIFYDQIKISDQKAAYIFTFMLAFLISSSDGRGVFSPARYVPFRYEISIPSAVLAASTVFSIICAIMVILPRRAAKTTTLFWGGWAHHKDAFSAAAAQRDINYLFRQYVDNVDVLSVIAQSKYQFVTLAFRGLVIAVLSYVLLLVAL